MKFSIENANVLDYYNVNIKQGAWTAWIGKVYLGMDSRTLLLFQKKEKMSSWRQSILLSGAEVGSE